MPGACFSRLPGSYPQRDGRDPNLPPRLAVRESLHIRVVSNYGAHASRQPESHLGQATMAQKPQRLVSGTARSASAWVGRLDLRSPPLVTGVIVSLMRFCDARARAVVRCPDLGARCARVAGLLRALEARLSTAAALRRSMSAKSSHKRRSPSNERMLFKIVAPANIRPQVGHFLPQLLNAWPGLTSLGPSWFAFDGFGLLWKAAGVRQLLLELGAHILSNSGHRWQLWPAMARLLLLILRSTFERCWPTSA